MRCFDCHAHIESGWGDYDLSTSKRNIIFNTIESFQRHSASVAAGDVISLVLDTTRFDFVSDQIRSHAVQSLKIHSRIQKIGQRDYGPIHEKMKLVPARFPIIIDSFSYGSEMEFQPSLNEIVHLIKGFPALRFVIAHAGGYDLLKYFFHLREFSNVWYDLSFSLQYLRDSSVCADIKKLIKFTDNSRVMYGSDYPFSSPRLQYEILVGFLKELGFSDEITQMIFFGNAQELFCGTP